MGINQKYFFGLDNICANKDVVIPRYKFEISFKMSLESLEKLSYDALSRMAAWARGLGQSYENSFGVFSKLSINKSDHCPVNPLVSPIIGIV